MADEQIGSIRKPIEISISILVTMAIVSLGFISVTDRFIFNLLNNLGSPLAVLADLRIPSLLLVLVIYFVIRRTNLVDRSEKMSWNSRAFFVPSIWIAMTAYFVLVKKVWVPSLNDWIDWTSFMVTGLIAEEILFRGILFDLCTRVFRSQKLRNFSVPVIFTSILFGLQHLSYHGFQMNPASLTQVAYTTVMGVIFARFKESTGRLWPVIVLHMITNSFTLIRNL